MLFQHRDRQRSLVDDTIDCVTQLHPTQSLSLYLRHVGRALRPAPGKTASCRRWHLTLDGRLGNNNPNDEI